MGARRRAEKVEQVEVSSLKAHPKNQSLYQDEPDAAFIEDVRTAGIRVPIIADRDTRAVISGRRRVKAAEAVGLELVPVIFRDYESRDDIVESIIKANWYRHKTQAQVLREVEALMVIERRKAKQRQMDGGDRGRLKSSGRYVKGPAKKGAGIERSSASGHVTPRKASEGDTARDRIGKKIGMTGRNVQRAIKVIEAAKAKHGNKWQSDEHVQEVLAGKKSIVQASKEILRTEKEEGIKKKAAKIKDPVGDIRCKDNIDDVLDETVDHVCVDPPYGVATNFNAQFDDRTAMDSSFEDWDEGKLSLAEIGEWCAEWVRVVKNGGNVIVFCSDDYVSFIKEALRRCGCERIQTITWHKTNPEPSLRQVEFSSSCEYIVVACKGDKRSVFNWKGQKEMHNFVEGPICSGRERVGHPTQKPLWLIKWLLERLTNKGDLVLDNFAGVGTTAVACKRLGRQFIAVEKSKKYVNAIKVRLAS